MQENKSSKYIRFYPNLVFLGKRSNKENAPYEFSLEYKDTEGKSRTTYIPLGPPYAEKDKPWNLRPGDTYRLTLQGRPEKEVLNVMEYSTEHTNGSSGRRIKVEILDISHKSPEDSAEYRWIKFKGEGIEAEGICYDLNKVIGAEEGISIIPIMSPRMKNGELFEGSYEIGKDGESHFKRVPTCLISFDKR